MQQIINRHTHTDTGYTSHMQTDATSLYNLMELFIVLLALSFPSLFPPLYLSRSQATSHAQQSALAA